MAFLLVKNSNHVDALTFIAILINFNDVRMLIFFIVIQTTNGNSCLYADECMNIENGKSRKRKIDFLITTFYLH